MIIGLIGRKTGQSDSARRDMIELIMSFALTVIKYGHEIILEAETAENFLKDHSFLKKHTNIKIGDFAGPKILVDVCVVMGGDGTMLNAAKLLSGNKTNDRSIPLLGINLGRVGFITDVPHTYPFYKIIQLLEEKAYSIESRRMLTTIDFTESLSSFGSLKALNEVLISRATGRVIEFDVSVDGKHAYRGRGDGVMIATPTGSTAYSLSAGGSIIHPQARVIEILPMMPQSMSWRPLIVNDSAIVTIKLVSGLATLTIDGNEVGELTAGHKMHIAIASCEVQFIHPHLDDLTYDYYRTLSEKLNWQFLPGTR